MAAPRIVFLDIERMWGTAEGIWQLKQTGWLNPGQIVTPPRTISMAWKWLGEDDVHFAAEWQGGQKRLAARVHRVLDAADYVVGWNSKQFDTRHIRSMLVQHNMHPPAPHKDIDLMLVCKRQFGFLSNRMSYIASQLGAESKLDTGGGLWGKLTHAKGDELREARELLREYNIQDVRLTEELFHLLKPWTPSLNVLVGDDSKDDIGPYCTVCGSGHTQYRGTARTLTRQYRRFQCLDCGKWSRETTSISQSTGSTPL